jgi:D-3-phosphoglycerate dehydrogenase / 2-oxoglutarate reductase
VPDYCRQEVSDHTIALILCMVRKITEINADVQRGAWKQLGYRPIHRLSSLTLGLVGFGRLGKAVASKASALGFRVIASDPHIKDRSGSVELMSLEALLQRADVISVHAPLLSDTKGLIGPAEFAQMRCGALIVNTSRGELIDEGALVQALDAGTISGAALDVFCGEPLPLDSSLRGRDNVILTPHIAFYSEESLVDLQEAAAEDVARVLKGEAPLHRVA